jgi:mono/diheme cytochrome c family protein
MSSHRKVILTAVMAASLASSTWANEFGRPATPGEIEPWDIDVRPDCKGLPEGSGTVAHGKEVYRDNCEVCHGTNGEGGIKDRLVGGEGSLASNNPLKTVGSYWPYATTLFDYIRRAMPYPIPGTLSADDTYAVSAYILSLNGILPADGKLDQDNLPKIKMPNRDGFMPDPVFKIDNEQGAPNERGATP